MLSQVGSARISSLMKMVGVVLHALGGTVSLRLLDGGPQLGLVVDAGADLVRRKAVLGADLVTAPVRAPPCWAAISTSY